MNRITIRRQSVRALPAAFLSLGVLLGACVSSEEAGTGKKLGAPLTSESISDSVRAKVDSMMRADSARTRRSGFTSKHDTLTASVVRKSASRPIRPIVRPENPAFTVQIGAFARTDHALQAQKLARERYADLPVFNTFEPYDKLYRVRIGKFDTRQQADSLKKEMVTRFPDDYPDCWINFISK
jgi:cell division septation protein DedD